MNSGSLPPIPVDDDAARTTRPGTPMIGPYSVNQMDDFYAALAAGEVKPTGVMNLLQRLFVLERCRPGDRMVDVCCGRGLQLPVLARYLPGLGSYTGLDLSADHLVEARSRLDAAGAPSFSVALHRCDVAGPWPVSGPFDVAVYTSSLEHLPRAAGVESLRRTAAALTRGGRLFLSTPNTPGGPPRRLQHRVHVYEWSHDELTEALTELGFRVVDVAGILPLPDPARLAAAVQDKFGSGGLAFYQAMADHAAAAVVGPVVSTALEDAAAEVMYVCILTGRP